MRSLTVDDLRKRPIDPSLLKSLSDVDARLLARIVKAKRRTAFKILKKHVEKPPTLFPKKRSKKKDPNLLREALENSTLLSLKRRNNASKLAALYEFDDQMINEIVLPSKRWQELRRK